MTESTNSSSSHITPASEVSFTSAICDALGVDPVAVGSITIRVEPDKFIVVEIKKLLLDGHANSVVDILRQAHADEAVSTRTSRECTTAIRESLEKAAESMREAAERQRKAAEQFEKHVQTLADRLVADRNSHSSRVCPQAQPSGLPGDSQ